MGPPSVIELLKEVKRICEGRVPWKHRGTIMIDVFMKKERHINCLPLQAEGLGPGNEGETMN